MRGYENVVGAIFGCGPIWLMMSAEIYTLINFSNFLRRENMDGGDNVSDNESDMPILSDVGVL